MPIERALVAFARGSGAWVLYASGESLSKAIDLWGRDADELGLLKSTDGWTPPMRGLWVWEGTPGMVSPWAPTFADGSWRHLTPAEWSAVQAHNIALWPDPAGFQEPRL